MLGTSESSGPFGFPARNLELSVAMVMVRGVWHSPQWPTARTRYSPLAVGPATETDRGDDLLVGPAPDARLAVRRDVGRVDGAERSVVPSSAGVGRLLWHGVAAAPAGRAEHVLAPCDVGGGRPLRARRRRERGQGQQERDEKAGGVPSQCVRYCRTKVRSVSSWISFATLNTKIWGSGML